MDIFLRAKAWKLFIVMFVVPFGFQFFLMGSFVGPNDPRLIFKVLMPIDMIIFIGTFIAWLWALGTRLYEYAPDDLRIKPTKLKFGLIYTSIYTLIFEALFTYMAGGNEPNKYFFIIFPFHILAMFFMFYSIYYIAKHLVIVEERKDCSFYYFSGPFFLLWFFPIGIWFIQPRINKLYALNNPDK